MSVMSARAMAPFAAMAAQWFVRKGLSSAYKSRTGQLPPQFDDTEASMASVLTWAVTTAVLTATIEVVVTRAVVGRSAHPTASTLNHPATDPAVSR
jgi:hypothetical protein